MISHGREQNMVEEQGLEVRNEIDERFLQFWLENDMPIMSTHREIQPTT